MSLTDVLGDAGFAAGMVILAGVTVNYFREPILDKYIFPWAEKLQERCDKDEKEKNDDYRISDNK